MLIHLDRKAPRTFTGWRPMELRKKKKNPNKRTLVGPSGQQTGQESAVWSFKKCQTHCIWIVLVRVEADWGKGAFPSFPVTTTAKTVLEKSAIIKMPCCLLARKILRERFASIQRHSKILSNCCPTPHSSITKNRGSCWLQAMHLFVVLEPFSADH